MQGKHSKHVKLKRTTVGEHARRELAIIGPTCDGIENLALKWASALSHRYKAVYVDQDHNFLDPPHPVELNQSSIAKAKHLTEKHWEYQVQNSHPIFSDEALKYDLAFLNGNHFAAEKCVLAYQQKRHNKLIQKDLSSVTCVISSLDQKEGALSLVSENCTWINEENSGEILAFLENTFPKPRLKALILSGGKSTRMGKDKGALNYHGKPQREHLELLLSEQLDEVYHSVRSDQELDLGNKIEDRFVDLGPFGAILSAMMHDPDAAWLVIACDLPNANGELIKNLVDGRAPSLLATAFHNPQTGWPDPLCTIYEPKAYSRMLSFLARGNSCPRKVLINSEIQLLELSNASLLDNVNTPEQYNEATQG